MRKLITGFLLSLLICTQAGAFGVDLGFGFISGFTPLPGASSQTFYLSFDNVFPYTFDRATEAWNPETGASVASGTPRYITGIRNQALMLEPASTNVFLNSSATQIPTTQSIAVTTANSGKWTCSITGAGTVTSLAGTATASGYGVATAGASNTITVTGNGTVVYTVAGANGTTRVQVENLLYSTSQIETAGTAVTRNAENASLNPSAFVVAAQGTWNFWKYITPGRSASSGDNPHCGTMALANGSGNNNIYLRKGGVNVWRAFTSNGVGTSSQHDVTQNVSGWTMFTIRWSATELSLSINGVKGPSPIPTPNIPAAAPASWFLDGNPSGVSKSGFTTDSTRIFNRVLTDSEVLTYYTKGL